MMHAHGWALPDNEQHVQQFLAKSGTYQQLPRVMLMLASRKYDLALDIGAHVGTWAREMAQHWRRVIAFEPIAENVACLRENAPTVEVEQVALGGRAAHVHLAPVGSNTGASFVAESGPWQSEMRTLDSYGLAPDAIKIDVEGFEVDVLIGAKRTIKTYRPAICVECKRGPARYGRGQHDAVQYLKALGYSVAVACNEDWVMKHPGAA